MEILWFIIIAFMLAVYVVLDGFDLGAGVIHLLVAKTDEERRLVLGTIGPVWDGNEVWLLAAGGTIYFAFPLLYSSSFSGFYLPLMIVLWLLMLRAIGIEFRHQIHHPMWRSFWDVVFSGSSVLLSVFFGAALGNVVRGVPLDASGYFFEPLWTTFTIVPEAGILDWFTVTLGLVALFTLTMHGAYYVVLKTEGPVQDRSRSVALRAWWGTLLTSIAALIATTDIRPEIWNNYGMMPWGLLFPAGGIAGLAGSSLFSLRRKDLPAFLFSSLFIVSMLCATAFGLFPVLLPSSVDPSQAITIYNASAGSYGLGVGLVWWILGMVLTIAYFIFVYRTFHGKVTVQSGSMTY